MAYETHIIDADNSQLWIHKPHQHWLKHIAEPYMRCNNTYYTEWLRTTYNIIWSYHQSLNPHFQDRIICSAEESDWLRFYLEWVD